MSSSTRRRGRIGEGYFEREPRSSENNFVPFSTAPATTTRTAAPTATVRHTIDGTPPSHRMPLRRGDRAWTTILAMAFRDELEAALARADVAEAEAAHLRDEMDGLRSGRTDAWTAAAHPVLFVGIAGHVLALDRASGDIRWDVKLI